MAALSETRKVDELSPYVNEESTTVKPYSTYNSTYKTENPIMMILRQGGGIRLLPLNAETTTTINPTTQTPSTTTNAPTIAPTTSSTTMQPTTTNTPQTAKQNKVTCALCIIVILNN